LDLLDSSLSKLSELLEFVLHLPLCPDWVVAALEVHMEEKLDEMVDYLQLIAEPIDLGLGDEVSLFEDDEGEVELLFGQSLAHVSQHELHESLDGVAPRKLEKLKNCSKHAIDVVEVSSVVHLELLEKVS